MKRRMRRSKQLLGGHKITRRYRKLKQKALRRTLWRTRFGTGYGPVERQTTSWLWYKIRSKSSYIGLYITFLLIRMYVRTCVRACVCVCSYQPPVPNCEHTRERPKIWHLIRTQDGRHCNHRWKSYVKLVCDRHPHWNALLLQIGTLAHTAESRSETPGKFWN
jgi:hypothetical protein